MRSSLIWELDLIVYEKVEVNVFESEKYVLIVERQL